MRRGTRTLTSSKYVLVEDYQRKTKKEQSDKRKTSGEQYDKTLERSESQGKGDD